MQSFIEVFDASWNFDVHFDTQELSNGTKKYHIVINLFKISSFFKTNIANNLKEVIYNILDDFCCQTYYEGGRLCILKNPMRHKIVSAVDGVLCDSSLEKDSIVIESNTVCSSQKADISVWIN